RAVVQDELQLRALHRTFEREPGDLAVALDRVPVTHRDQGALDLDRKKEPAAGDQLLAVEVAARRARRNRRARAADHGRHADDAEERTKGNRTPRLADRGPRVRIQAPAEHAMLAAFDSELSISGAGEAAGRGPTPTAGPHGLDLDFEHHARPGAADRHRPAE